MKKYYRISIKLIPQEIIYKYDLDNKKVDVYIYVRVVKWMDILVKSGIIFHESLKEHLQKYG